MKLPNNWDDNERERWEERAAIMEYHGGLSRDEAEFHALALAMKRVRGGQQELFKEGG